MSFCFFFWRVFNNIYLSITVERSEYGIRRHSNASAGDPASPIRNQRAASRVGDPTEPPELILHILLCIQIYRFLLHLYGRPAYISGKVNMVAIHRPNSAERARTPRLRRHAHHFSLGSPPTSVSPKTSDLLKSCSLPSSRASFAPPPFPSLLLRPFCCSVMIRHRLFLNSRS